jgi:hypothetical protein
MYTRDSIVAVRSFTRQREGEEVVIGSPETGVFLAVPPEAVEFLDLLALGKSLGEVSDLYFAKDRRDSRSGRSVESSGNQRYRRGSINSSLRRGTRSAARFARPNITSALSPNRLPECCSAAQC